MVKDLLSIVNETNNTVVSVPIKNEYDSEEYMGDFFKVVQDIYGSLSSLKANQLKIKKLQNDILSTSNPKEEASIEVEELSNKINSESRHISMEIKKLQNDTHSRPNDFSTEQRIKITQLSCLTRNFKDSMIDYNIRQLEYKKKCKDLVKKQFDIVGNPVSDEQLDKMIEQNNVQVFTSNVIQDTEDAKQTLAEIEARHKDILQLEKSINELSDMINEMSTLIFNQGEQINRIDHNVTLSRGYVEKANIETKKAVEYQSKARKKRWIILGIGIAIVVIIVLSVAISLAKK